jgi:hypothetical protein
MRCRENVIRHARIGQIGSLVEIASGGFLLGLWSPNSSLFPLIVGALFVLTGIPLFIINCKLLKRGKQLPVVKMEK